MVDSAHSTAADLRAAVAEAEAEAARAAAVAQETCAAAAARERAASQRASSLQWAPFPAFACPAFPFIDTCFRNQHQYIA